jgi:hypothetical protein
MSPQSKPEEIRVYEYVHEYGMETAAGSPSTI